MSNDDERMIQAIREAGYGQPARTAGPWRACCRTRLDADHLADCDYLQRELKKTADG